MGDLSDWFLSSEDYLPDPFSHEHDEPYYRYRSAPLACRYCKSRNVCWGKVEGRWRLYTGNKPHTCNEYSNK